MSHEFTTDGGQYGLPPLNTTQCERCLKEYSLRDGHEPTKYCDACAHEVAEHADSLAAALKKACLLLCNAHVDANCDHRILVATLSAGHAAINAFEKWSH